MGPARRGIEGEPTAQASPSVAVSPPSPRWPGRLAAGDFPGGRTVACSSSPWGSPPGTPHPTPPEVQSAGAARRPSWPLLASAPPLAKGRGWGRGQGEGERGLGGLRSQPGPRSSPSSAIHQLWASDRDVTPPASVPASTKGAPRGSPWEGSSAWEAGTDAAPELTDVIIFDLKRRGAQRGEVTFPRQHSK